MPVGIDLYDELEMLVASRKPAKIVFKNNGSRSVIHGRVADLSDLGENAFVKMDSGLEIKLTNLIEVNGKGQSNLC